MDDPYLSIRLRGGQQILYAECRKARVFVPEDQKWAMTDWAPQAVAAGLKRMAMVTAEAGLAKSIAEDVSRQIDQHGLSMRTFHSVAEATVWAQTGLTEPKPRGT